MRKVRSWIRVLFGDAAESAVPLRVRADADILTVSFTQTSEAFKNPMKGFRPSRYIGDSSFPNGEYSSTFKQYIAYTDLERSASDTAGKIVNWSGAAWAELADKNEFVIPRVVILYPGAGEYWGGYSP